MTAVLLDTGPLGLASNPKASPETEACTVWLLTLLQQGVAVYIPEIADYEVRRELIRGGKTRGLARLNELKTTLRYLPLSTEVMLRAADYWAFARQQGTPTATDAALDGDVILAAQADGLRRYGVESLIATTNVKHLSRFVPAKFWQDIT